MGVCPMVVLVEGHKRMLKKKKKRMLSDGEKWKTLPGRKAESDNDNSDVSIHINGLRSKENRNN